MLHAAERLGKAYIYGFEKTTVCADIYEEGKAFSYAVLPVQKSADGKTIPCPFSNKPIPYSVLGKIVKKGGTVFTGYICPELQQVCGKNGFHLENYLEREELAVMNAIPTAEGAIAIAVNETDTSLFGEDVLVAGFGRIAKILVKYLVCMGARVTAACRKARDRSWAEIYGANAVDITDKDAFSEAVSKADIIFNTVPCEIFNAAELSAVNRNILYIELASSDGIFGETPQNVKAVTARGLPGKTAPLTAGQIIADTILNILAERSDTDDV